MHRICAVVVGVLLLTCSGWAGAQDTVFFDGFESGDTTGWWAPARVGKTGQKTCYDHAGTVIACAGTGQDGDIQPGITWPNPRFVDNSNGTVTDMLTGLIWLKDASCSTLSGTDSSGRAVWMTALMAPVVLINGVCGLNDGTVAGDWRLPSVNELQSLFNYEYYSPALSDAAGTAKWSEGDPFVGVYPSPYWSSTSLAQDPSVAWFIGVYDGYVYGGGKEESKFIWPVRNGR